MLLQYLWQKAFNKLLKNTEAAYFLSNLFLVEPLAAGKCCNLKNFKQVIAYNVKMTES